MRRRYPSIILLDHMPATPPVRVDVIFGHGESFAMTGRVARLILWLCRNAERINSQPRGELLFGFRGDLATCRLAQMWDSVDDRS